MIVNDGYLAWIRALAADVRSGEWPWTGEGLMRRVAGEEGRGVLVSELIGDEDGPGDSESS